MHDLIVIGAGPAGMAAARQAAETGLSVLLLDEQPRPGGQVYRDVSRVDAGRARLLGPDYAEGLDLVRAMAAPGIEHLAGASVWQIEEGACVNYTRNGRAARAEARRLLIATGAIERPMPIPGWTLPGVMTAGAAQILLKSSGLVPGQAVLAGSGPLLYLVAVQMSRAGTPPLALVETQGRADLLAAMRHLPGLVPGRRYLRKGLSLLAELSRAGVKRYRGARNLEIHGDAAAEALSFTSGGRQWRLDADMVLLHHGVVPNTQAARSVGIEHRWNPLQHCFWPIRDGWGRTSLPYVFIAGDGAGIGGAKAAVIAGRLAALAIAADLGRLAAEARDRQALALRKSLAAETAIRPFLDTAYPPCREALSPADATLVCRCEEVTAGDIRRYAGLGCIGPNQAKAFCRAGMGACQGRYCGLSVTAILAEANGQTPDETGYYNIRPPLKPLTLGELAAMDDGLSL